MFYPCLTVEGFMSTDLHRQELKCIVCGGSQLTFLLSDILTSGTNSYYIHIVFLSFSRCSDPQRHASTTQVQQVQDETQKPLTASVFLMLSHASYILS